MKIMKTISSLIGLFAVVLCTAFAIKMPNVYKDLFGIVNKEETTIQRVPYYVNFGDLGTSDSSYKTQYFQYANRTWYLSWGNHGGTSGGETSAAVPFNMLLGWNSQNKPVYGSYSYGSSVMETIEVKEGFNYSYLIMDFDFDLNHLMELSFSPFENLTKTETSIYLICSHNLGKSWSVLDSKRNALELIKDSPMKFTITEDNLVSRTTRYGIVLVSNAESARIELDQFIVSRLSVS